MVDAPIDARLLSGTATDGAMEELGAEISLIPADQQQTEDNLLALLPQVIPRSPVRGEAETFLSPLVTHHFALFPHTVKSSRHLDSFFTKCQLNTLLLLLLSSYLSFLHFFTGATENIEREHLVPPPRLTSCFTILGRLLPLLPVAVYPLFLSLVLVWWG